MESMQAILALSGTDRPGLLDDISKFLLDRGGSIADSRLASLDGKFALLCRVSGTEPSLSRIKSDLGTLSHDSNIHAELHPHDPSQQGKSTATYPYRFSARGVDQTTLLNRVSHLFRVLNINIENLETRKAKVEPGQPDMTEVDLTLAIPRETPVSMLKDYLAHLCGEMNVLWHLSPV